MLPLQCLERRFECAPGAGPVARTIRRRAVRVGLSVDNTKSYGYSISRESGTALRVTWEAAPEGLGSDAGTGAMTFDARAYRHAGPRHAALALRAAGASAWGDSGARRVFSASGPGPQAGDFNFGRDAVGLLRGLDTDAVVGHHALVGNVDYRFPLRSVQRGIGTVGVLSHIQCAACLRCGHAWNDIFAVDVRFSAGAGSRSTRWLPCLPVTPCPGVRGATIPWARGAASQSSGASVERFKSDVQTGGTGGTGVFWVIDFPESPWVLTRAFKPAPGLLVGSKKRSLVSLVPLVRWWN